MHLHKKCNKTIMSHMKPPPLMRFDAVVQPCCVACRVEWMPLDANARQYPFCQKELVGWQQRMANEIEMPLLYVWTEWSLTERVEVIHCSLHYANELTIKGFAFISNSYSIALQTSWKVRYCYLLACYIACLPTTDSRIEFSTFLACLLNFTSLSSVVLKVNSTKLSLCYILLFIHISLGYFNFFFL